MNTPNPPAPEAQPQEGKPREWWLSGENWFCTFNAAEFNSRMANLPSPVHVREVLPSEQSREGRTRGYLGTKDYLGHVMIADSADAEGFITVRCVNCKQWTKWAVIPPDPRFHDLWRRTAERFTISCEDYQKKFGVDQSPQPDGTSSETAALKPCPFCGGDAYTGWHIDKGHWVQCRSIYCWPRPKTGIVPHQEIAIQQWNKRADLDSQVPPNVASGATQPPTTQPVVPPKSGQPNISAESLEWLRRMTHYGYRDSQRAAEIISFIEGAGQ